MEHKSLHCGLEHSSEIISFKSLFSEDDENRVVIQHAGRADYINASHVDVPVGKDTHRYIACQGPLPQTTGDFWQMVWEQRSDVIAMVTLAVESGKVGSRPDVIFLWSSYVIFTRK